jgi:hypothetical protein
LLGYQGKYDEAEGMHRQVLDIRQRMQVPEHPDGLTSMGNLALVLDNQGKYDEAEGDTPTRPRGCTDELDHLTTVV